MKIVQQLSTCAAVATLTLAGAATADIILFESDNANSTEQLGSFDGSLEFTSSNTTSGTLTITLFNTTDPAIGGFLTGFLFNFDAPSDVTVTLNDGGNFGDIAGQNAPPFGNNYRAGAAIGNNWTGGGAPQGGIAAGSSQSFNFDVLGNDVNSLTTASFFNENDPFGFVVRFRGMANGGSDKVPSIPTDKIIPAPGALALFGAAFLAGARRRRA